MSKYLLLGNAKIRGHIKQFLVYIGGSQAVVVKSSIEKSQFFQQKLYLKDRKYIETEICHSI